MLCLSVCLMCFMDVCANSVTFLMYFDLSVDSSNIIDFNLCIFIVVRVMLSITVKLSINRAQHNFT